MSLRKIRKMSLNQKTKFKQLKREEESINKVLIVKEANRKKTKKNHLKINKKFENFRAQLPLLAIQA